MNRPDLDWLLRRLHSLENRRIGKTFAAAALTKKVNGILLTFNEQSAKQIRHEYEVDTASIRTFKPQGSRCPIIVDQDAFVFLCMELLDEHNKLREQVKLMRDGLEGIDAYITNTRFLELDNAPYVSLFRFMANEIPESIQEILARVEELDNA